jgi:hypothetical protein
MVNNQVNIEHKDWNLRICLPKLLIDKKFI